MDTIIPQLKAKVKKLIRNSNVYKVFSAKPFTATATSLLPVFRRNPLRPFEVTGVDFAGPLIYMVTKKEERNILHNYIYVRHVACGSFGTGKIADMQLKSFKHNWTHLSLEKRDQDESYRITLLRL